MPTITISLPSYVTELQAEPFPASATAEVAQTVTLTGGAGSIVVAATGGAWCWRFTECGPGYRKTRFAAVAGDIAYGSLVDLDPGTLVAALEPADPAWEAMASAAVSAAANVMPTIAGGALGIVTHIGPKTRAAVIATLNAAEALGRGIIVFFPAGDYDIGSGISLSGYTCQIRGAGAHMLNATTPAGTVFYASTQSGPALDFKGWIAPTEFSGRVRHGDFFIRGSGAADPTKLNAGFRVDLCQSTAFTHIATMGTGGPGLRITADVAGYACYLCDFDWITIRTPVGADVNDVPYVWATEPNGNRFGRIGIIARTATQNVGVSGAVVFDGSNTYAGHDNKIDSMWFEYLHVPTNGCLISVAGNSNIIADTQFFDSDGVAGSTNTAYIRLLVPPSTNFGGNEVRGVIPGDNNGAGSAIKYGVDIQQSGNSVVGTKGYRGNNVLIGAGVDRTHVHLRGSVSTATTAGWVDNSGTTTNHLIDSSAKVEVLPAGWATSGVTSTYLALGSVGVDFSLNALYGGAARNAFQVRLTASVALTSITNAVAGTTYTLTVTQDNIGSRTLTWPANIKWAGSAPTLTATLNKTDMFAFFYDGTNFREVSRSLNES